MYMIKHVGDIMVIWEVRRNQLSRKFAVSEYIRNIHEGLQESRPSWRELANSQTSTSSRNQTRSLTLWSEKYNIWYNPLINKCRYRSSVKRRDLFCKKSSLISKVIDYNYVDKSALSFYFIRNGTVQDFNIIKMYIYHERPLNVLITFFKPKSFNVNSFWLHNNLSQHYKTNSKQFQTLDLKISFIKK